MTSFRPSRISEVHREDGISGGLQKPFRTEVVAEGKTADECKDMEFGKVPFAAEQIIEVNLFALAPAEANAAAVSFSQFNPTPVMIRAFTLEVSFAMNYFSSYKYTE